MKKILLLSDTHSHIDEAILKYARQADEIWHAGDIGTLKVTDALAKIKPVRAVYGNIDDHVIQKEFPENNRFFCEGVDVWLTHIGGYPGKYEKGIRKEINDNPPKLFICGHSHILKVMPDRDLDLLHMNPGAIGHHGIHHIRTLLTFQINAGKISDVKAIELVGKPDVQFEAINIGTGNGFSVLELITEFNTISDLY